MEQLWFYFDLGLWHVLDAKAIDHLLFIAAFTVPYHFEALRKLLWWTTLFTVGHTLSLMGNYYFALNPPSEWIEFLIPISILFACVPLLQGSIPSPRSQALLSLLIFVFGIIHGFGFGRYFGMIVSGEDAGYALFSFAFGVEAAQIVIILCVLLLQLLVVRFGLLTKEKWKLVAGAMILSQALEMTLQNWPG